MARLPLRRSLVPTALTLTAMDLSSIPLDFTHFAVPSLDPPIQASVSTIRSNRIVFQRSAFLFCIHVLFSVVHLPISFITYTTSMHGRELTHPETGNTRYTIAGINFAKLDMQLTSNARSVILQQDIYLMKSLTRRVYSSGVLNYPPCMNTGTNSAHAIYKYGKVVPAHVMAT